MGLIAPGTTNVPTREEDLVWTVIHTIDNRLDDIAGIRPVRAAGRILTGIAPANVIKNVTGMEKPSEMAEDLFNKVDGDIRAKRFSPQNFIPGNFRRPF